MEKKNFDIQDLIERTKLSADVERQMETMRPQILDDINRRIDADTTTERRSRMRTWIAAASVAVVLFIAGIFMLVNVGIGNEPQLVEIASATSGAITRVALPDGTIVEMNVGTHLSYDKSGYGKHTREITLDGEAFFDVTKNPDVPFIVHNGNVNVKVLGTRFNVEGYLAEADMKVTLESGKVSMTVEGDGAECILVPGQQGVYLKEENRLFMRSVDVEDITSWTEGGIYFDDLPLSLIARRIERRFGVNVKIESPELAASSFTGAFSAGDSVGSILLVLSMMDSDLGYRIQGKDVVIYSTSTE